MIDTEDWNGIAKGVGNSIVSGITDKGIGKVVKLKSGSGGKGNSGKNEKSSNKGTGKAVFENGRASIDTFKSNPKVFSGKSAEEVAKMLEDAGYEVTVQASKKSRSGAKIIKIQNTESSKNITQVQVSPGGGRHGDSPYVKISTSDQGIIKIVDGSESVYKTDGVETATVIFTGRD
ncbi:hypothetical protein M3650_19960 [Paenibacillus sp. MER TA 81-3]|uniref:hypothetical protein n=1 Tax=Paenibacillus sp. MER TA 81-3 TaxID=2939573 RepID=UPI00203D6F35|nr:hypothetical protein [Paenibacillus sp. MER TA 81-3]MCM3340845.1 hypothetical protein [Paenibacillus sp. MER TA 81-3]